MINRLVVKNECSGCHACYNICPNGSIKMQVDEEGFLYPKIEEDYCNHCGLCEKVCPVLRPYVGNEKGTAYACINENEEIRMQSSSGGIFSLIAQQIIKEGGVVFGAAFDSEWNVYHLEISNEQDLYQLRGSKYLQSRIGEVYKSVREYLKNNRKVLFSGTPCQISGLKAYLKKENENLVLQDIVCHGVPSPKVWQKYLEYQCTIRKTDINKNVFPNFRSKKRGWNQFSLVYSFENGTEYQETLDKDLFMQAFLNNLCLRPSCYKCHSKSLNRESDITLADFWGVEKILPEMFDDKGTSLVFVNTEKGKKLFNSVSEKIKVVQVEIDEAVKTNTAANQSVPFQTKRDIFMKDVMVMEFEKAVGKAIKKNFFESFTEKTIYMAKKGKRILRRVGKRSKELRC